MIRELNRYFSPLRFALDAAAIAVAFTAAVPLSIRFAAQPPAAPEAALPITLSAPAPWGDYLGLAPLLVVLPLLFLARAREADQAGSCRLLPTLRATGLTALMTAVPLLLISGFVPSLRQSFPFLTLFLALLWAALTLNRLLLSALIGRASGTSILTRRLLVIGTNGIARQLVQLVRKNPQWGIAIVGCLSTGSEGGHADVEGAPVVGTLQDFPEILSRQVIDSVFVAGGTRDLAKIRTIAARCELEGLDFGFSASALGGRFERVSVGLFDGFSLVFLEPHAHSASKLFIKRVFDIVAAATLILLLLPLWIIVPIWIRLDSSGPVIYRSERLGKHGRRFMMYKFRSMVVGADKIQEQLRHLNEMDGPVFKIKEDPRFTGIGKLLRRTSIDELPQLFNVLRGEMSLVGPRPPIAREVALYQPWQKKRLSVTPGITCLWQVTGRNEIKFDEWMQLDLQYIENWSLTLDFKILVKTVVAVLSRHGAE